jgi:low temperature requirement protein LtrA
MSNQPSAEPLHHHLKLMRGRDPGESNRASTPLELLFDLVFATAFSLAAEQVANELSLGRYWPALIGFAYASLAISWAWINFSWFSSGFDTDDWEFRLATMVQMIGAMLVAIGLPRLFASIDQGAHFDNGVMIAGYVIMRLAYVSQWLRVAISDPGRRRASLIYAAAVTVAQLGWVSTVLLNLSLAAFTGIAAVLAVVEVGGPIVAERAGEGTPWHPEHMADRYSVFFSIGVGEAIVGTIASLAAAVGHQSWTVDAALIGLAGMGLTFALWWLYDLVPSGQVLRMHRNRALVWGYLQLIMTVAVFAIGAGLHVAAAFLDGNAAIGAAAALLCIEIPVVVFLVAIHSTYLYLLRQFELFHLGLAVAAMAVAVGAIIAALAGVSLAVSLVILMWGPTVTVVGYEVKGHRDAAAALSQMR